VLRDAPAASWPAGVRETGFEPRDAAAVAAVFTEAYRDGSAGPFDGGERWYEERSLDREWDGSLVRLARCEGSGRILGACHGWTGGFLKDLGVLPSARGRGIADALVLSLATRYRLRSLAALDLKVLPGNEPARRFYARLGFRDASFGGNATA